MVVENLAFQLLKQTWRQRCCTFDVCYTQWYEYLATAAYRPEPEKPASPAGGSSYALNQPLTALLCTRAMTLTSHHHHWNECLRGQEKCTKPPESLQHRSEIQGEWGEGPDSAMVNSLAKLFWHLDQTWRHFWIPFFCKPSPQAESHFPFLLRKQKRLCMMPPPIRR